MKKLFYITVIVLFSSCEKTYICEVRGEYPSSGISLDNDIKIKAETKGEALQECATYNGAFMTATLK